MKTVQARGSSTPCALGPPARRLPRFVLRALGVAIAALVPVQARTGEDAFVWPLDTDPALTSTFGEHRFGYFHSGIDLSTWGEIGLPALAIGDGSVYRVRASGVGYGRAVYVRLDAGPVVLYAHLNAFSPDLDAYVRGEQERLGRYEVDLRPDPTRFRVRRGEAIATTGESGAGPPHLHLEIRNGAGDVAVNPLGVLKTPIVDTRRPTIVSVSVTPASPRTLVAGGAESVTLTARRIGEGRFACDTTAVTGPVVLGAHVFDKAEGKELRLAVYALELHVEGELRYASRLDSIPYSGQREVDLVYDALRVARGQRRVRRLYRPRGSDLSVHGPLDGRLDPADFERHARVEVVASDWFGNESRASLVLERLDDLEPRRTRAGELRSVAGVPEGAQGSAGLALHPADEAPATISAGQSERDRRDADRSPGFAADLRSGVDHGVIALRSAEVFDSIDTVRVESGRVSVNAHVTRTDGAEAIVRFPLDDLHGALTLWLSGRDGGRRFTSRVPLDVHAVSPSAGTVLSVDGASLEIGEGVVFAPECVMLRGVSGEEVTNGGLTRVSDVYGVGPEGLALERAMVLGIAPADTTGLSRVGVYARHPRRREWVYLGGEARAGGEGEREVRVEASIRGTGRFCLIRDDAPPVIRWVRPRDLERLAGAVGSIRARLRDVGSGLSWRDLRIELDGKPLIAEWNPEAGVLEAPLRVPLANGEHVVRVQVTDQAGNAVERSTSFTVVAE